MMVTCPKCNFTQPQDRYCANCGVDMLAFKPAEKPLLQKLLGNWVFQVSALILIVIVAFSTYRGRLPSAIDDRVSDIDDAPTVRVIEETQTPTAGDSRPQARAPAPRPSDAKEEFSPQATGNSGASAPANPAQPPAAETAPPGRGFLRATESALGDPGSTTREGAPAITRLRIVFAEAQRPLLAELISNTRSLASYGSFNGGVISDLPARLKAANQNRTLRALDSASEHPVRLNQPIVVFKGARDAATEQNIGITTQIVPTAVDDTGVTVQVEVLRVLREPTPTPQVTEQTFQETFTIPRDGGAFLAGTLPRRQLNEDESRMYSTTNVLRVLTSPAYQSSATDFLIFIEAH